MYLVYYVHVLLDLVVQTLQLYLGLQSRQVYYQYATIKSVLFYYMYMYTSSSILARATLVQLYTTVPVVYYSTAVLASPSRSSQQSQQIQLPQASYRQVYTQLLVGRIYGLLKIFFFTKTHKKNTSRGSTRSQDPTRILDLDQNVSNEYQTYQVQYIQLYYRYKQISRSQNH